MLVSEATEKDLKVCNDLMKYWQNSDHLIKGHEGRKFFECMEWLQALAMKMVECLRSAGATQAPASDTISNVKIKKSK